MAGLTSSPPLIPAVCVLVPMPTSIAMEYASAKVRAMVKEAAVSFAAKLIALVLASVQMSRTPLHLLNAASHPLLICAMCAMAPTPADSATQPADLTALACTFLEEPTFANAVVDTLV